MEDKGMVTKEQRANRLYYAFRQDYPFYGDLVNMVAKTTGLGIEIIKNKNKIGQLKYALISGKFIRQKKHEQSDVDLLVVGEIVLPQLAAIIREFEAKIKKEINYTAMTKEEFEFRKKRRDPFILSILFASRVIIIGDEEELIG
jgi:predicted nucleotidyltransferase